MHNSDSKREPSPIQRKSPNPRKPSPVGTHRRQIASSIHISSSSPGFSTTRTSPRKLGIRTPPKHRFADYELYRSERQPESSQTKMNGKQLSPKKLVI